MRSSPFVSDSYSVTGRIDGTLSGLSSGNTNCHSAFWIERVKRLDEAPSPVEPGHQSPERDYAEAIRESRFWFLVCFWFLF
jgi:hypothetical protein